MSENKTNTQDILSQLKCVTLRDHISNSVMNFAHGIKGMEDHKEEYELIDDIMDHIKKELNKTIGELLK